MKLERKYLEEEKKELVQTFIVSGDSMNRWCKKRNLPNSTFHGWIKKYSQEQFEEFMEIKASSVSTKRETLGATSTSKGDTTLVIEYGGFKIGVTADTDTAFLSTLLKAVVTLDV